MDPDIGPSDADATPPMDADADVGPDTFLDPLVPDATPADTSVPRMPLRCGGSPCLPGEECCYLTGECFDPATPESCRAEGPDACASNADCDPEEYCAGEYCLGPGTCERRPDPGCSPEYCACDGNTYPGFCDAAHAGVRPGARGACGSSPEPGWPRTCGDDGDCDSGGSCCLITNLCLPADCPDCCVLPPAGSFWPCRTDAHCGDLFCDLVEGCGGLGYCALDNPSCEGLLDPVCGCDGLTYAHECWAARARVSIAHPGACAGDAGS